jgi:hypothetical protein
MRGFERCYGANLRGIAADKEGIILHAKGPRNEPRRTPFLEVGMRALPPVHLDSLFCRKTLNLVYRQFYISSVSV